MSVTMNRRAFAVRAGAMVVTLLARPAWAGSYLDRAALLLWEGHRETEYLRIRLNDRELARTIHQLAAARVNAASTMGVPKEVVQAHPHLLLVLENYERGADAAKEAQQGRFLEHRLRAHDEEAVFRGVLKQLGWTLPEL